MKTPTISILIPAYNTEKYIRQCLDSIVHQTYRHNQVVIVDDGSTDSTAIICDDYAHRYSFVEVHHIPNGGVANARNLLLSKIKGDYFLFVDADDWIENDMVEVLVNTILKQDFDIAICNSIKEDGINQTQVVKSNEIDSVWAKSTFIEKFIYHRELNGSLWNKLIRTKLVDGIQFDKTISYGEDALFLWSILHRTTSIANIWATLYHYRMNEQSISHAKFDHRKMSCHKVWKQISDDTKRLYPQFYELAKANFAVSDFWLLYYASLDNYVYDNNIRCYQENLKQNLSKIKKMGLLSSLKYICAIVLAHNYALGGKMLRLTQK